jgi:hypothetical protein
MYLMPESQPMVLDAEYVCTLLTAIFTFCSLVSWFRCRYLFLLRSHSVLHLPCGSLVSPSALVPPSQVNTAVGTRPANRIEE